MHVITARNVNDAYRAGMRLIAEQGILLPSRNGPVRRVTDPVTTKYTRPTERVLFDIQRDANPFFHLFEALWMLSGANDVRTLDYVLQSFREFSDDGRTFHGAYGYRWRHWPSPTTTYDEEIDQLAYAIDMLKRDASTRRVVIGMWDPRRDLAAASKDLPCNDIIKVAIVNGALDIQVFNRSNDIIYGCYGANAVHMSVLQEYLAGMIDVPVGRYFQISGDFHAYTESPYRWDAYWPLAADNEDPLDEQWVNPYRVFEPNARHMTTNPLVTNPETFDAELHRFVGAMREKRSVMALDPQMFENTFFGNVAIPMHWAFEHYLAKDLQHAIITLENFRSFGAHDNDWLLAGQGWIETRLARREMKALKKPVGPPNRVIVEGEQP